MYDIRILQYGHRREGTPDTPTAVGGWGARAWACGVRSGGKRCLLCRGHHLILSCNVIHCARAMGTVEDELKGMKVRALKRRAREVGVEESVDGARLT